MDRRSFLQSSAALAVLAPLALRAADATARPARQNRKGFMFGTLRVDPKQPKTVLERFKLLRAAGFAGVEVNSGLAQKEVLDAQAASGLAMASVTIATHWSHPLSSPNPSAREVTVASLKQGLRDAKAYGAKSVLLVPAVVNKDISYADAYTRSIAEIKKAIPLAEELGVAISIENVWNAFLMSPLEAAAYVDQFKSPMVRWHFDVGNVVNTGWPQHWIQVLGPRIANVHIKEFSRKLRDEKGPRAGFGVDLLEGDSDWPAVMAALDAAKYDGWLITEQGHRLPGVDDATWLAQISQKLDQILAC
ncbi:MAG: sugar phosphate isomerase/epimerase [Verrucomicrobia bacterium]|nr:sugar phosphate isomerase/epimerase [Verrucomicrobiota bacterium]